LGHGTEAWMTPFSNKCFNFAYYSHKKRSRNSPLKES